MTLRNSENIVLNGTTWQNPGGLKDSVEGLLSR